MIEKLYFDYLKSTGVSTDTRTVHEGNIWFALKGPNFNANKFATQALEKGAVLAVIDDADYHQNEGTYLVSDALLALQELANYHRRKLSIPFLGITGSNGKTTTKELVRDVLSKKYVVHATKGNLNNHIGVPLTLLSIDDSTEFAIIEMGANAQGEIKRLCEIAQPDYGLITNIGKAHLEGFGGSEGIFKGKTELYDYLGKNNGKAFVNTNNQKLVDKLTDLKIESKSYAKPTNYFEAKLVEEKPNLVIEAHQERFETKITGGYNFENICSALCVGQYFNVDPLDSIKAVSDYDPDNNRSQVILKGTNTIVMDAYNANPSSMAEALKSFDKRSDKRKVIIIGDMLELGAAADKEHLLIGQMTRQFDFEQVHFCGPLMKEATRGNGKSFYWETKDELEAHLREEPIQNATILIKGSRGMSLETLLDLL